MYGEHNDTTFIKDTVRQLCCGLECYVYKEEQVNTVKEAYKEKTGLMLNVKKTPDGYLLKPIRKVSKYHSY